jgi:hypothetical protein
LKARLLLLVAALPLLACPGSSSPRKDGSTQKLDGQQVLWPDVTNPYPDYKRTVDKPKVDQRRDWYAAPDTYVGAPFGCLKDSDCFGQKCCPTVWGVKLCADDCQNL